MALIVALNVVLAALVVAGILALMSWGIAADRAPGAVAAPRARPRARGARRRQLLPAALPGS